MVSSHKESDWHNETHSFVQIAKRQFHHTRSTAPGPKRKETTRKRSKPGPRNSTCRRIRRQTTTQRAAKFSLAFVLCLSVSGALRDSIRSGEGRMSTLWQTQRTHTDTSISMIIVNVSSFINCSRLICFCVGWCRSIEALRYASRIRELRTLCAA